MTLYLVLQGNKILLAAQFNTTTTIEPQPEIKTQRVSTKKKKKKDLQNPIRNHAAVSRDQFDQQICWGCENCFFSSQKVALRAKGTDSERSLRYAHVPAESRV
mmetsp:Transcript_30233/g.115940  ORF Transcript_30233/g.115940 Transcript_30233/m.115940 type:complete len:103 (-) Transcript_30233:358-666(-)